MQKYHLKGKNGLRANAVKLPDGCNGYNVNIVENKFRVKL